MSRVVPLWLWGGIRDAACELTGFALGLTVSSGIHLSQIHSKLIGEFR